VIFFFLTGKFNSSTEKTKTNPEINNNKSVTQPKLQNSEKKLNPSQEYYSILIGPYSNFKKVKIAYEKFINLGYAVKIISPEPGKNDFFQLSIGHYPNFQQAQKKKEILKKHEEKQFSIKKNY
jgi:hypothetical protein